MLLEFLDVVDKAKLGASFVALFRKLAVVFQKRAIIFLRLLAFHLERAGDFALQGVASGLQLRDGFAQVLELGGDHAVRLQAFPKLRLVDELLDDAVKEILIVDATIDRLG